MAKFLVTGGAGFIGSNLIKKLLREKKKVIAIDNFSIGKKESIKEFLKDSNFAFFEIDVRDSKNLEQLVKEVDIVFHLAATSSVAESILNPDFTFDNNIRGTLSLLNAARKCQVKKIVFASSAAVYGSASTPQREDMIPSPISPYATSKLNGEKLCHTFSRFYGVPTICLRYFNVFGPYQDPYSDYAAVIPKFIDNFLRNRVPVIFGDGRQTRDFIYVGDVVDANLKAADSEFSSGEVFNVAFGQSISILRLADLLKEIFSRDIEPVFRKERREDIKFSLADITKIEQKLSWRPVVGIKEGLLKTVKWFKTNAKK